MSAVSMPIPIIRANMCSMGWVPLRGSPFKRCLRAVSIALICSRIMRSRARSRRNSASVFGGSGSPSGPCSLSRPAAAWCSLTFKLQMPNRTNVALVPQQRLVLSRGASRVFLGKGRDCHHIAVLWLTTEPAKDGAAAVGAVAFFVLPKAERSSTVVIEFEGKNRSAWK